MLTLTQVVQGCHRCDRVPDDLLTSVVQGLGKHLNRQRAARTNIFACYRVDSGSTAKAAMLRVVDFIRIRKLKSVPPASIFLHKVKQSL
jgi:hypothetical protein